MKKSILILLIIALFSGCSKKDDPSAYSALQQKVFAVFTGTFQDNHTWQNQGPDRIVFTINYPKTEGVYQSDYLKGQVLLFNSEGECDYYQGSSTGYIKIPCYYDLTVDASHLYLYQKDTKDIYDDYNLIVQSETEFFIWNSRNVLRYDFVKQ